MSDFPLEATGTMSIGGTMWPRAYASEAQEYQHLTTDRVFLDFSKLGWLRIHGKDAASFLQGMVSQDALGIAVGQAAPSWILDANGKIVVLLHIFRVTNDSFLLQTPPQLAASVYDHLDRYLIMEEAELSLDTHLRCLTIQGPGANSLTGVLDDYAGHHFAHDRCGFGGIDWVGNGEAFSGLVCKLLAQNVRPAGMAALNQARIEAFLPWFQVDMAVGENPMVYGEGGRISAHKGCFVGQETVAKTRDRGHPPRLLARLCSKGKEVPANGAVLTDGNAPAGTTTSAVWSSRDQAPVALATLKYAAAELGKSLADPSGRTWLVERLCSVKAGR